MRWHHHQQRLPTTAMSPLMTIRNALSIVLLASSVLGASVKPYPVGGFALCQTPSSVHIQGGTTVNAAGNALTASNGHYRLDLSQKFDSTTDPTWANLTLNSSPYQRFIAGACSSTSAGSNNEPALFYTVGNADAANTDSLMQAYSLNDNSWSSISAGGNSQGGRTLVSFVINSAATDGMVLGGATLGKMQSSATFAKNFFSEQDLLTSDVNDGKISFKSTSNNQLGAFADSAMVVLPGTNNNKVLILGGLGNNRDTPQFSSMPIQDLTTGAVTMQKVGFLSLLSTPAARYGHCAVLAADGSKIYMFGGALVGNDRVLSDLYILDLTTWNWSAATPKGNGPPAVRNHRCIMVGDQLLSFYGINNNGVPITASPGVFVLSTTSMTWTNAYTPLPNTPSPPPIGGGSKVPAAGIAFAVIFSLAFFGMGSYFYIAHRRKQQRKAYTKELLAEQEAKKKAAQQPGDKEDYNEQDGYIPYHAPVSAAGPNYSQAALVTGGATPPMTSQDLNMYSGGGGGYQQDPRSNRDSTYYDSSYAMRQNSNNNYYPPPPPPAAVAGGLSNPFLNSQELNATTTSTTPYSQGGILASNPYYAQAGATNQYQQQPPPSQFNRDVAANEMCTLDEHPTSIPLHNVTSQPLPSVTSSYQYQPPKGSSPPTRPQQQQQQPMYDNPFIPEEMGHR